MLAAPTYTAPVCLFELQNSHEAKQNDAPTQTGQIGVCQQCPDHSIVMGIFSNGKHHPRQSKVPSRARGATNRF